MRFLIVLFFIILVLEGDDAELYKKLQKVVSQKDSHITTKGDTKVIVSDVKDTNLTKSVKKLLKKENIEKNTKKYEKILKD